MEMKRKPDLKSKISDPRMISFLIVFLLISVSFIGASVDTGAKVSDEIENLAAEEQIDWKDYEGRISLAENESKPVLLDFYATWCGPCQQMDEDVYTQQKVIDKSEELVCIKVDIDQKSDLADENSIEFVPTTVYLSPDGEELFRREGYRNADAVISDMDKALQESGINVESERSSSDSSMNFW